MNESFLPISNAFSVQSQQNYQFCASQIKKNAAVNLWNYGKAYVQIM